MPLFKKNKAPRTLPFFREAKKEEKNPYGLLSPKKGAKSTRMGRFSPDFKKLHPYGEFSKMKNLRSITKATFFRPKKLPIGLSLKKKAWRGRLLHRF